MNDAKTDEKFMNTALLLAAKGLAHTSPNPVVGAVIVKGKKIISKGYHSYFGGPHAEVDAIKNAKGHKLAGTTMYVTLEPCCTQGKTPPCTQAILDSGITRVVVAVKDPNPAHAGRGIEILRQNGIEVTCGVLEPKAAELNAPFFKFITTGLPFITVKMAATADGKTATTTGLSKWISCPQSRKKVHRMRKNADAVMVGINTVKSDNPELLPYMLKTNTQPWRIVVDPQLGTPPDAKILHTGTPGKVILMTTHNAPPKKKAQLEQSGAKVLECIDQDGLLSEGLTTLAQTFGITNILCEGGSRLAGCMVEQKLADRVVFFIAPKLFGGKNAPGILGAGGFENPEQVPELENVKMSRSGTDFELAGTVVYPQA